MCIIFLFFGGVPDIVYTRGEVVCCLQKFGLHCLTLSSLVVPSIVETGLGSKYFLLPLLFVGVISPLC